MFFKKKKARGNISVCHPPYLNFVYLLGKLAKYAFSYFYYPYPCSNYLLPISLSGAARLL